MPYRTLERQWCGHLSMSVCLSVRVRLFVCLSTVVYLCVYEIFVLSSVHSTFRKRHGDICVFLVRARVTCFGLES